MQKNVPPPQDNAAKATHRVIATDNAPKVIGPYSQGVVAGGSNFVFVSGQIPLNPRTMALVADDIRTQTEQVIVNLRAVLASASCNLNDVVKTTIFLTSMDDFEEMNAVYAKHFSKNPPARATVEVSRLPKDVKVEIEAIALVSGTQEASRRFPPQLPPSRPQPPAPVKR